MVCFLEALCPYLLTWFCSFVFWIPSHSLAPWFSVVVFVLLRKIYFGSLLEWFLFWLGDARQNLTDSTCLSCWGLVAQKINKQNPGMNLNVWKKLLSKYRKRLPVESDSGRLVMLILFSRTLIFEEFGAEITKVRVQKEKKNFKNYSGHIQSKFGHFRGKKLWCKDLFR